jgi:hypothetical protein
MIAGAVTIETDNVTETLHPNQKTQKEWLPYVGQLVRKKTLAGPRGYLTGCKLIAVHRRTCEIQPPNHRRVETVPLDEIRPWVKGEHDAQAREELSLSRAWILRSDKEPGHYLCQLDGDLERYALLLCEPMAAKRLADRRSALEFRRDYNSGLRNAVGKAVNGITPILLTDAILEQKWKAKPPVAAVPSPLEAPEPETVVLPPPEAEAVKMPAIQPEATVIHRIVITNHGPDGRPPEAKAYMEALETTGPILDVPAPPHGSVTSTEGSVVAGCQTCTQDTVGSPEHAQRQRVFDAYLNALAEESSALEMASAATIKRELAWKRVEAEELRQKWHLGP